MQVNAAEMFPFISELLNYGNTVSIGVNGSSMHPFLDPNRDSVILEKPKAPLKKGDIVAFSRGDGAYILHRVTQVSDDGTFYTSGDNRTEIEGPISPDRLIAVVKTAIHKSKPISRDSIEWNFYAKYMTRRSKFRNTISKIIH